MIRRWLLYAMVPFAFSFGFFLFLFLGGKGNRTDSGDVCDALGQAGEYVLSFGDWSCDPNWSAMAVYILAPTLLFAVPFGLLCELARLAEKSRKATTKVR